MDPNEFSEDRTTFIKKIENETDRQLLERQTYYLASIEKSSSRTKRNIQFFFYFFIITFILSVYNLTK